jgi:hypothetical protein
MSYRARRSQIDTGSSTARPSGREDLAEMVVSAGSWEPAPLAPVHCPRKTSRSASTPNCPTAAIALRRASPSASGCKMQRDPRPMRDGTRCPLKSTPTPHAPNKKETVRHCYLILAAGPAETDGRVAFQFFQNMRRQKFVRLLPKFSKGGRDQFRWDSPIAGTVPSRCAKLYHSPRDV